MGLPPTGFEISERGNCDLRRCGQMVTREAQHGPGPKALLSGYN